MPNHRTTRRRLLEQAVASLTVTALPTPGVPGQPAKPGTFSLLTPADAPWHQRWLQARARSLHADRRPPKDLQEWKSRRKAVRANLRASFGIFPKTPCDLAPKTLGILRRTGYHIERLLIQSRPGVWITANAYVPTGRSGKVPAILAVHGHWPWARIDPHVQARCLGLVKLGYFVLAVDAFGAGERAADPRAKSSYHGSTLGAGLWPVGAPLLGMQVYDNMRAADYLQSRPEVDPNRLAITGASGGGNQTMYAGAFDERFKAVVPVCSVGTFQSYLTGANCVCETLIAGLTYCEEADVLALVAPRALLVINATRDALCFSVGEAAKSIAAAKPIFELHNAADRIRHLPVESKHDYNQPMREAMYGWLNRWLRGKGDGSPAAEPPFVIEKLNDIRCFADKKRPVSFHLIPSYLHQQAQARLAAVRWPETKTQWQRTARQMRRKLRDDVFGMFPQRTPLSPKRGPAPPLGDRRRESFVIESEPDMPLPGWWMPAQNGDSRTPVILCLHPEGIAAATEQPLIKQLMTRPCHLLTLDLRGTGQTASPKDRLGSCPDHNSARWSIWLGRPLLAQWVWDIIRTVDYVVQLLSNYPARPIAVVGFREAGLAAIFAAALDTRITHVAAVRTLASYVTNQPFAGQRMAALVPNILTVGDIPHLAALVAPRRLTLAAPINAQSKPLSEQQLHDTFHSTRTIYEMLGKTDQFVVTPNLDPVPLTATLLVSGLPSEMGSRASKETAARFTCCLEA